MDWFGLDEIDLSFESELNAFMPIFFLILLTLLSFTWFYVTESLLRPVSENPLYQIFIALFAITTWGLQIWRITQFRNPQVSARLLTATYFSLGLFCQFLVLTILKDLSYWIYPLPTWTHVPLIFLGVMLNTQSLFIAKRGPVLKNIQIPTQQNRKPLRIVQISDLHVGPIIQTDYVEKVISQINQLNPDILVATGDIGDGDAQILFDHLRPFLKIDEKVLKFYIPGNHEYYWNVNQWIHSMEKVGFQTLINRGTLVSMPEKTKIWIGGVPDPQGERFIPSHKESPDQAIAGAPNDVYKILLAHQPKSCFQAQKAGFDLMLCGHTHGGQFFPFTMLVGFFNPYSRGLNDHLGMKVYVNLGTGFWGPPLRLGAQAEITVFDLN